MPINEVTSSVHPLPQEHQNLPVQVVRGTDVEYTSRALFSFNISTSWAAEQLDICITSRKKAICFLSSAAVCSARVSCLIWLAYGAPSARDSSGNSAFHARCCPVA